MSLKQQPDYWQCGRFRVDLTQPRIMGIVNITPDSFSDGGMYDRSVHAAVQHAEQLLKDGADILDIGGESSRPGADWVSAEQEWARVAPVLRELAQWSVPISLDTRRTNVMRQALMHQYADIINDIQALTDEGALALLAQQANTGVCLMHMRGLPENMQHNPQYVDVATEVGHYLRNQVDSCLAAGIARERIVIDPGFGFGKTTQHNIDLMQHFADWQQPCGCPALIGVSRKHMLGDLAQEPDVTQRAVASVVAAVAAVAHGAAIVRVHDVRQTRQGLQVWQALGGILSV